MAVCVGESRKLNHDDFLRVVDPVEKDNAEKIVEAIHLCGGAIRRTLSLADFRL